MKKLFLILLLGTILRLYQISSTPPSLYWDEAAVAYNAYSIFHTARDEYGNFLPLIFRSFNDYKMPGFVYLTAPFVGILGLTEFATRLPSVTAGIIAIALSYFLTLELLGKKKVALLTAFLLAISPWHLQFSRTGFEANVALTIFLFGFWLFLLGLRGRVKLAFSFIVFAVAFYFYRSIIGFLPFFLGALFLLFDWKKLLIGGFLLVLISFPIFNITLFNKGIVRLEQVSILTNPTGGANNRTTNITDFTRGYLDHFSPSFLFLTGDSFPRHKIWGMGLMYFIELPLLLAGLFFLWKMPIKREIKLLLLVWALAAPLPAAVAVPTPHALRSLNILPLPQMIVAIGMVGLLARWKKAISIFLCAIYIGLIGNYLTSYYGTTARLYSSIWADGYKQLAQYVFANEGQYAKVLVTGHDWQPYIYFLFYKSYDPTAFQKSGNNKAFAKYVFGPTGWDEGGNRSELQNVNLQKYASGSSVLVALSPDEYGPQKQNITELTRIYNHNNELVFIVGKLK